jgi:hypothetical protein
MNTYGGAESYIYVFMIYVTRHKMEVSGRLYASAALPPRKEPPVPVGQEAG